MKPCDVCLNLDRQSDEHHNRWQLSIRDDLALEYSVEFIPLKMEASAGSGCPICSIIWHGLELMSRERRYSLTDERLDCGRLMLQPGRPLEVELFDADRRRDRKIRLQYYTIEDQPTSPWQAFGSANDVPSNLSIEKCVASVRSWIEACRKNHEGCVQEDYGVAELPTRILDLESPEGSPVVLIESRDGPWSKGCYATLSHCWGDAHFIQTTKQSLAERKTCIKMDDLPRTFQDAVTVARALSIRFLWIDSLCIIQDDELDWQRESQCMAVIYSKGFLNIAATGSSDSNGGCLSRRRLMHVSPTCNIDSFPIRNNTRSQPEKQEPIVYVRPSFDLVHHRYLTHENYDVGPPDTEIVPLLSRAWVFQERHLAPRTLHFHPSELIMECKSGLFCECTGLDKIAAKSRRESLNLKTFSNHNNIFDDWFKAVGEYSRLRLTRATDRLVALIGVATVFRSFLRCGYFAGIWEDDIARGLLWDVTRYGSMLYHRKYRLQRQFAPTWSWASLVLDDDSAIDFIAAHDDNFQVHKRFLFLGTDLPPDVAESSHGSVREVRIQAAAIPAIVFHHREEDGEGDTTLVFDLDNQDEVVVSSIGFYLDVPYTSGNPSSVEDGETVHCIIIGTSEEIDRDSENEIKTEYLCTLVVSGSSSTDGGHQRLGVMDIRKETGLCKGAQEMPFLLV